MLNEEADLKAVLQHCEPESAKSQILSLEHQSQEYKDVQFFKGSEAVSGMLSRIDVPDVYAVLREGEETPRIPLVVKEDIEEALLPHTMKRFTQYQETPFGSGERRDRLGMNCDSDDFEALPKW